MWRLPPVLDGSGGRGERVCALLSSICRSNALQRDDVDTRDAIDRFAWFFRGDKLFCACGYRCCDMQGIYSRQPMLLGYPIG